MNEDLMKYLKGIVDNGTTYMTVKHVYRGDEDVCLKTFGEQDEECIKHNAARANINPRLAPEQPNQD